MPLNWISPTLTKLRRRARTDAALARAADLVRKGAGVPRFGEATGALMSELDRARRYEHTLGMAILAPRGGTGAVDLDGDPGGHGERVLLETHIPGLVSLLAGSLLREALRESDILAYDAVEDRFVILLAQTEGDDAREAVLRLDGIVRMRLRLATRTGLALFPRDGLTMEDLLRAAEEAWRNDPVEAAEAAPVMSGTGGDAPTRHANGTGVARETAGSVAMDGR